MSQELDLDKKLFQIEADNVAEYAYKLCKENRIFWGTPLRRVLSKIVDSYKKTGTIDPNDIKEAEGWINETF